MRIFKRGEPVGKVPPRRPGQCVHAWVEREAGGERCQACPAVCQRGPGGKIVKYDSGDRPAERRERGKRP